MIIDAKDLLNEFSDYDFSKVNEIVLQRRLDSIEQKSEPTLETDST